MNTAMVGNGAVVTDHKTAAAARNGNVGCYMTMHSNIDGARNVSKVIDDGSVADNALLWLSNSDGLADNGADAEMLESFQIEIKIVHAADQNALTTLPALPDPS